MSKEIELLGAMNEFFKNGNPVHPGALLMDDDKTVAEHVAEILATTQRSAGEPKLGHPLLTDSDAVEIYYALDGATAKDGSEIDPDEWVGVDGEYLSAGDAEITADMAESIYDAVSNKYDAVKSGMFGRDREAREWAEHLSGILETIGNNGVKLVTEGR